MFLLSAYHWYYDIAYSVITILVTLQARARLRVGLQN